MQTILVFLLFFLNWWWGPAMNSYVPFLFIDTVTSRGRLPRLEQHHKDCVTWEVVEWGDHYFLLLYLFSDFLQWTGLELIGWEQKDVDLNSGCASFCCLTFGFWFLYLYSEGNDIPHLVKITWDHKDRGCAWHSAWCKGTCHQW